MTHGHNAKYGDQVFRQIIRPKKRESVSKKTTTKKSLNLYKRQQNKKKEKEMCPLSGGGSNVGVTHIT